MINYLIDKKTPLFWMILHVILGGICIVTPLPLILWFYLVLGTTLYVLITSRAHSFIFIVFLIAYTVSFELLARMSQTSPYIPYELGKYLLFVILLLGIVKGYRNGRIGWLMLFLLLPGVFIDISGVVGFKNIVFNLLGPLNVALAIIFFRSQAVSEEDFRSILRLLILPMISVLAFVIIKTPDFGEVEFNLGANFQASGGWGSNQVATALGLGAFITFIFWRHKWNLTGFRWLDFVLLLLFTLRGLMTFSRGGMIGGVLGIMMLLLYETDENETEPRLIRYARNFLKVIPIILLFIFVFRYADRVTEGNLALRYKGETPGTMAGTKEKTLNVFTSNRLNVFKDDLSLWREHPILGVGAGASSFIRKHTRGIAAHVELSRLISEHGIPGLTYFLILTGLGLQILRSARRSTYGPILLAIFVLAIFTTFHSAMRTYISPLLIGISLCSVIDLDRDQKIV